MATVRTNCAGWDGDNGFVDVSYDDVTLLITGVTYQNLSSQPAQVTFQGHSFTLTANTPLTTINVSNFNLHMVATTSPRGIAVNALPGALQLVYPA